MNRNDPMEKRKLAMMRQALSRNNRFNIGGIAKEGHHAPKPITLPKLPWSDEHQENERPVK
jgi:hypothetical protein